jgi:hypothetical protein
VSSCQVVPQRQPGEDVERLFPTVIAKAMVATTKQHPALSATHHYPEMMALIESGASSPRHQPGSR